jgi:hypothetical protein
MTNDTNKDATIRLRSEICAQMFQQPKATDAQIMQAVLKRWNEMKLPALAGANGEPRSLPEALMEYIPLEREYQYGQSLEWARDLLDQVISEHGGDLGGSLVDLEQVIESVQIVVRYYREVKGIW